MKRASPILLATLLAWGTLGAPKVAAVDGPTPVQAHAVASVPLWPTAETAAAAGAADEPPAPRPGMLFRGEELKIVDTGAWAVKVDTGVRRGFVRRGALWPGAAVEVATTRAAVPLLELPETGATVSRHTSPGAVLLVVGAHGDYRLVNDEGRRTAWARATDLVMDPFEVKGALLLERGRACAARGKQAEVTETYWSAVRGGVRPTVIKELSDLLHRPVPSSGPSERARPALTFSAGDLESRGPQETAPKDPPLVLVRPSPVHDGDGEAVDWTKLARRFFTKFSLDGPAPAKLLSPAQELFEGPTFGFDAPVPPSYEAQHWYVAAAGGIAAVRPVRLAGKVHVRTDSEAREVGREFGGTLALSGLLPASSETVLVISAPHPVRFAVRDVLYGGRVTSPTPGEQVTLDASDGDRVRAFLAASPRRPLIAYVFELVASGPRYLFVSWEKGEGEGGGCESLDQIYDIGPDLREVFSLEYDCDA